MSTTFSPTLPVTAIASFYVFSTGTPPIHSWIDSAQAQEVLDSCTVVSVSGTAATIKYGAAEEQVGTLKGRELGKVSFATAA